MAERFLLADVGGTNTRVGLADMSGLNAASVETFRNAEHAGLSSVLTSYLAQHPEPITALCAGVAGPVRGDTAQLTNLDWFIDASGIQSATGAGCVHLINYLHAQGVALDDVTDGSITEIRPGAAAPPHATRLVLGLGTGCNIAVVQHMSEGLFVPPSETGHTSLPHLDGEA